MAAANDIKHQHLEAKSAEKSASISMAITPPAGGKRGVT